MKLRRSSYRYSSLISLAAALPLVALGCGSDDDPEPNPNPPIGATEFVSADGVAGQDSGDDIGSPAPPAAPGVPEEGRDNDSGGGDGERTVEEGDIYRLVGDGYLLNLNRFRGLQIIDISNPMSPSVIGRLAITGSPVEMYGTGDQAIILLNEWRGYYGGRDDIAVDTAEGGLVMNVDLSDPANPVLLDQAHVPGYIQTSRLTRDDNNAALYVAASEWGEYTSPEGITTTGTRTVVKSFDVTGDEIVFRSEFDLGGYVSAIQATPEMLLVARTDWNRGEESSQVTLVDISKPDGTMSEHDTVATAGHVVSQFHMDFRGDVLRIISGPRWGNGAASHLETWDATNPDTLVAIDSDSFGAGDSLYAAIFLEDRAFAVTYQQVDPFHAFSVDSDGNVEEMSEYIVSGWNDFFRPVLNNTRLIGIGVNDENGGREVAVSLYDITDLTNPEPLVARAEVEGSTGGWSWSEANWDHRAFTVLDQAVETQAETGETETGLVLLPFSGWNEAENRYISAVQIYTFSDTTLTRRGLMDHGSSVRRSFVVDTEVAVNLSDSELGLFNHSTPDTPAGYGSLMLAPNYTDLLAFGTHRARIVQQDDGYWYAPLEHRRPSLVEIIPADEHADRAIPVAQFEIPAGSQVYAVGDLLVAMTSQKSLDSNKDSFETYIEVFDLSDPSAPIRRSEFVTDQVSVGYGYGYWDDCFDCRSFYDGSDNINVVGNTLTFLRNIPQQKSLGTENVCYTYVDYYPGCWDQESCSYYAGGRVCRSLNGGSTVCTGEIAYCSYEDNSTTCEPVELNQVENMTPGAVVSENCSQQEAVRYWSQYEIDAIDLSNPNQPTLAPRQTLPASEEGVSLLAEGDKLYATVKRPINVPNDPRSYVRYAIMALDYTNPAVPAVGPAINVPGELLTIDGDTIYTRDLVWGEKIAETAIVQLRLEADRAYLLGHRRFVDREVEHIAIDERGLALVSHRPLWQWNYGWGYGNNSENYVQSLTVLSPSNAGLNELAEVRVDTWATLRTVASQRALFQVPGGVLVFNLENASTPAPQAYFATPGWPSDLLVDNDRVMFPAGRYGIHDFGLETFNLLTP